MLAVEIYFYGSDEPVTIPLAGLDAAKAQFHFERLRSEIIEAQLHTDPRISIKPVAREQDVVDLDPSRIEKVLLVDPSQRDATTTDEIPAVAGTGKEPAAGTDPGAADAELTDDLQRRIEILLD